MAVGQNRFGTILVGRCTTQFRTYFSGDWDVHWKHGVLTHGHVKNKGPEMDIRSRCGFMSTNKTSGGSPHIKNIIGHTPSKYAEIPTLRNPSKTLRNHVQQPTWRHPIIQLLQNDATRSLDYKAGCAHYCKASSCNSPKWERNP